LVLPHVPDWADPVWHLFVVRSCHRDALREHLTRSQVETAIHYPIPPQRQPAYRNLAIAQEDLPISDAIHREVLSLPIGPHLGHAHARWTIDAIRRFEAPATLESRSPGRR
jgi:dTDP-4-amino-4,6-dideoxygalactose transaminase